MTVKIPGRTPEDLDRWLADSGHTITNTAHLLAMAARWTDQIHLQDGEEEVTFAEMAARAGQIAALLRTHGVGPGDRVFIHGRNSVAWVASVWGAWRASAVPVLGNPSWSTAEVIHAVQITDSSLALVDSVLSDHFPPEITALLLDHLDGAGDELVSDDLLRQLDEQAENVRLEDPAAIVFTSGTTEFAKAAVLPQRSFLGNLRGFVTLTGKAARIANAQAAPANLVTAPLFHIGGIHGIVSSLVEGGKRIFLSGRFDAGEVLRILETERIRSVFLVPTALNRVLAHPSFESTDLSALRSATLGAAPVSAGLLDRLRSAVPSLQVGVNTGYGMTESGGAVTAASGKDVEGRTGTAGRPLPWSELRIHEPDADGIGEILIRTTTAMLGYMTRDGLSECPADNDGWIRSGDVGRLDDDGYLWIEGRTKDVIIRGGENISAARVEAVLAAHPAVIEVAAIGLPDTDWGETVAAVVQVNRDIDEDELREHALGVLARYEVPNRWSIIRDPLPTNAMGKILKRELTGHFA